MHLSKMGSRVKEDERHEMTLRKLVKNGENRKCINCGSLVSLSCYRLEIILIDWQ
jgi:hypothetical protein